MLWQKEISDIQFAIYDKIVAITVDNAANMYEVTKHLQFVKLCFFAHILNLVQSLYSLNAVSQWLVKV